METNYEIIKINRTKSQLRAFDDEKLKEKARQMSRLAIHIALIDIRKDEPEILATNLTPKKFTTEDLKELYNKRTVETEFDRLKNLIKIEDLSRI